MLALRLIISTISVDRQSPATTDAQVDVKWRLICDFLEGLQAKGVHSYQSKVDEFWNRFGQEELYNVR